MFRRKPSSVTVQNQTEQYTLILKHSNDQNNSLKEILLITVSDTEGAKIMMTGVAAGTIKESADLRTAGVGRSVCLAEVEKNRLLQQKRP